MKTIGVNLNRVLRVRERMEVAGCRVRVERNPIDHEGPGGSRVCRYIYDVYAGYTWVGARYTEEAANQLASLLNENRSAKMRPLPRLETIEPAGLDLQNLLDLAAPFYC